MPKRANEKGEQTTKRTTDAAKVALSHGDDGLRVLFRGGPEGPREFVVACRVEPTDLAAIDVLVEAGLRGSRSEAAAWLIREGIEAQSELLEEVRGTVAQIRKLRQDARTKIGKLVDRGGRR